MRSDPLLAGLLGSLLMLGASAPGSQPASFPHEDWTAVLSRFVDERGRVDYEVLARERATFDRYVARVQTVSPETNPELFPTRQDELAYYLNTYNALVFKGVLDRGPERKSVWRGLISGYIFFVGTQFMLGGRKTYLKQIEDEIVRERFQDPRVHAALNCASIGCPRLPQEAYDPDRLDAELDAAMVEFVGDEKHVRLDHTSQTVVLSQIFDWFREDFLDYERRQGNAGATLIDYLNRYRSDQSQVPRHYKIRFLKYDKRINKQ